MEDGVMMRLIKKMGYKTVTDFYNELADEHIDVNRVIDLYLEIDKKENEEQYETRTAEEFTLQKEPDESKEDELVIGGDWPNAATPFTATKSLDLSPQKELSRYTVKIVRTRDTYTVVTVTE